MNSLEPPDDNTTHCRFLSVDMLDYICFLLCHLASSSQETVYDGILKYYIFLNDTIEINEYFNEIIVRCYAFALSVVINNAS